MSWNIAEGVRGSSVPVARHNQRLTRSDNNMCLINSNNKCLESCLLLHFIPLTVKCPRIHVVMTVNMLTPHKTKTDEVLVQRSLLKRISDMLDKAICLFFYILTAALS